MSVQLTETQVVDFRRDGFVVVRGALDDAEIENFGAAVDAAVAHRTSGDERSVEEKTLYEQSFIQCMNLWEDHPDVRALTFHPRLGEMAGVRLGRSAVLRSLCMRTCSVSDDLPSQPRAHLGSDARCP